MTAAMDPVSELGLAVAIILAVAKLGGDLASRLRQPAVLGELLGGVVLGSIQLPFFQAMRADPSVDMLARLGVLILLFQVGLDSTVQEVMRVGIASVAVAILGTIGTLAAGLLTTWIALPHQSFMLRLFLAASITATSIGISARVLRDAGAARSPEAHTILGASVLDDVLGLAVLAIVSGAAAHATSGSPVNAGAVAWIVIKTVLFLSIAIAIGVKLSPRLFQLVSRLRTDGALVATGLSLCFVLAWASNTIGLAPIVGAFTAGLILEESHSARFVARGEPSLAERMKPISSWLVPIFFVLMGMRADFRALAQQPEALLLTAALGVAAVVGKLTCALGAQPGTDRVAVALGMLPRGEVSLVFANLGLSIGLLDSATYAALVTVILVTTLVTPAVLRRRLESRARPDASHARAQ